MTNGAHEAEIGNLKDRVDKIDGSLEAIKEQRHRAHITINKRFHRIDVIFIFLAIGIVIDIIVPSDKIWHILATVF